MDRHHTKTVVSRLLHQSILELCKASVPQEQCVQVDGIVCISIGDDDNQIVVKVHEQIGSLQSVSHVSSSQNGERQRSAGSHQRFDDHVSSEYQRKRRNLHSIASAASAKRLRMTEAENKVESSTTNHHGLENLLKGDVQLLTTIKTEIPTDDEPANDSENSYYHSERHVAGSAELKHTGNKTSLNRVFFQDLECEHCKLLLPTFDELQAHNQREHKCSTCGYCWRSFHNFSNYQQHLKTHRRMQIGSRRKHGRKETVIKWKKCGICRQVCRTVSGIMEHLHDIHDFEKCFTCSTCNYYFPCRQTFITHRREMHTDVQQCRCENCEIYFSYMEFKHHKKECFESHSTGDHKSQSQSLGHCDKVTKEEPDDGEVSSVKDSKREDTESETECGIKADSVFREMLLSEENSEKSVTAVREKSSPPAQNQVIGCYSHKSSEDESSSSQSDSLSGKVRKTVQINLEKSEGKDIPENGDNDEDGDDEDGNNSDNDGSETSLGDSSDFLSMLAVPDIHALIQAARDPSHQFEQVYSHGRTFEKSVPHACQGPFRCQTCFFVIEDFEDFERHCFEMHCRYVCTYCAQTFANRRNLQRHIRRHVGDMPYVCDECGQRFYRDDNLRRHKLKHMTSVRFVCAYCSTPYENKNKLTSHLIGGHAIDVLKVTDQEIMKHVILKDDPVPHYKSASADHSSD